MKPRQQSMFSKQHYEFIADVLRETSATQDVIRGFVLAFCKDNPKFMGGKFHDRIYR